MAKSEPKKQPVVKSKPAVSKPVQKSGLGVKVYDLAGAEKTSIDLPKELQTKGANPKLLAQYVRVYLANQRQGNASTKSRGQVRGSTRKIYKQKGTGRARHGSRRAPIFVGGGIIGGPKSKDFSLKINKKQRKIALFTALTLKYKDQNIVGLVKEVINTEPKAKIISKFFKQVNFTDKKVLFILPKLEKNNFVLAIRNIPKVQFIDAYSVNPYVLLNSDKIVFVSDALDVFAKHFAKKNEN